MSSLYQRVLGDGFAGLPEVLQAVHGQEGVGLRGVLTVRWSKVGWLRALLHCSLLPRERKVDCRVWLKAVKGQKGKAEGWQRQMGQRQMNSRMCYESAGVITEHMGLLKIRLKTEVFSGGIRQRQLGVSCLGVPLPFLQVIAREYALDERRYRCNVYVGVRGAGRLISYSGVLWCD